MYVRDRQSVFFAFFFPLFFMLALGFMVGNTEAEPIEVSMVTSESASAQFVASLNEAPLLNVHEEDEAAARQALQEGGRAAVIFAPETVEIESDTQTPIRLLVDSSEPQTTEQIVAVLQSVLIDIEHSIRGTNPLYTLAIEDVEARNLRYVDFLIPGLVAFMIMQLSVAGSGFNIVEYKRKGILKRLFVTPLRPFQFISSLILSRLIIVLMQISVLLLVAKLVFDISIQGSLFLVYLFVIFGSILFLGIGFAVGGIAKTQSAVMAIGNLVIFPQVFLAGVFFSLTSLPDWIQPVAGVLPLSFVSDALRQIANEGADINTLGIDILGILVWTIIGVFLAVRLFRWGDAANT